MTEEEALLQAIQEDPEDDLARLALADWLEERSDPRGRYLRVEAELCGLSEHTPRCAELETELQQLRASISPEWLRMAGRRYDLILSSYPPELRLDVIKVLRDLTGLQLVELKEMTEALPASVLKWVERAEAEQGRDRLRSMVSGLVVVTIVAAQGSAPPPEPPPPKLLEGGGWGTFDVYLRSCEPDRWIQAMAAIQDWTGKEASEVAMIRFGSWPVRIYAGLTAEGARLATERFWSWVPKGGAELEFRAPDGTVRTELPTESGAGALARAPFELVVIGLHRPDRINEVVTLLHAVTRFRLTRVQALANGPLPVTRTVSLTAGEAQQARKLFAELGVAVVLRPY
jgi:uncharacterized protein (TIGR02996 family)